MEEKIKNFFEVAGKKASEHLGSEANILITSGKTSYALKITEEREIKVEKDGKESRDIEISGEEEIMNDLFSSSSNDEFSRKARSYIRDGKEPKGKILMERTLENVRKFNRVYYHFLREMFLIK